MAPLAIKQLEEIKARKDHSRTFPKISLADLSDWQIWQEYYKFRETDYPIKPSEWRMLDYANPAWQPASFREQKKAAEKIMNNVLKLERKEQPVKAVSDGSEPPKDWLRLLPKGTIFLSRELKDKSSYVYDQFTILRISARGIYLKGYLGISKEETPSHLWVNSEAFSESNEFIEVLREEKKEKT